MIVKDRRFEFGELLKGFRIHFLEMSKSELGRILNISRETIIALEKGTKNKININALCFLLDLGFPIQKLKDDSTRKDVEDYLRLKQFKRHLNHHRSKKLRFHFDVFCELNKEYIKENYVEGVLEKFNGRK